jgi:hypothetical protein
MKTIVLMMAIMSCMASCGNKKQQPAAEVTAVTRAVAVPAYELDSLLAVAGDLVDKTVSVSGFVTHTCKHSGKRCFIVGKGGETSFRVEATGEIGGFNRELVGSEIRVKGVVKERRLTSEFLDQHEKEVNEQEAAGDGSAESCAVELASIREMREWMKARGRDYYSIYFMEGTSYEVVGEE